MTLSSPVFLSVTARSADKPLILISTRGHRDKNSGLRSLAVAEGLTIIDEIQRIPELLNEVHYLIEDRGARFLMTGSSARKLRRAGVNLLGGRARTFRLY